MIVVRAALFNVGFFGWTITMLLVCLPAMAAPPTTVRRLTALWARGVLWLARWVVGLDYRITGEMPDGGVIFAVKHQSAWDTIVFLACLKEPVYVLKQELMRIPLYGRYARLAEHIAVDRAGGASALKAMVSAAKAHLDAGRPVVIFPQGTRVVPGGTAPYHPGIYALAKETGARVVPIALNSGVFWGRRAFLKTAGTITVAVLPALEPGLDRRRFMGELEQRIETATTELEASVRQP